MLQISNIYELRNIQCFTQAGLSLEKRVVLVQSAILRAHEEHDTQRCHLLATKFKSAPYLWTPIIVERDNATILDGHHRSAAVDYLFPDAYISALILGDYQNNSSIEVVSWDTGEPFPRRKVARASISGQLLRQKTTRHIFGVPIEDWHREKTMNFPILNSNSPRLQKRVR